jgi:murein DD-endopeptidase MepM/ murein hydrolase activator NlpD
MTRAEIKKGRGMELLSNEQDEKPMQAISNKGKDLVKMYARRAIKEVAKKLIKQLIKLLTKILIKFILKALIWLLALFGIEAIIIFICVIVLAGAAIFIGKAFGWITDDSVDKKALLARYEKASYSTSTSEQYRAPVWLLQYIDNVRILKENRDPKDIDPEGTVRDLSAEEHKITKENSVTSWSVDSKGVESGRVSTPMKVNLTSDVQSWNRNYTFQYSLFTDEVIVNSVTTQDGSHTDTTTSRSTSSWIRDTEVRQPIQGGSIIKYTYKTINTNSPHTQSSNGKPIGIGGGSSKTTSQSTHTVTSHWEVNEIDENPNYEKFESTLIYFNFSRSDYNFLLEGIKQEDPNLISVDGFATDNLAPSADDAIMGGGGSSIDYGGPILDSPDIPASSEWAFPTNKDAIVTSGFGYRFDPVYKINKLHKGVDLARADNKVSYINYAVDDGEVVAAGDVGDGYGNKVVIDHGGGIKTLYGHMQSGTLQVKIGDKILKGKALGVMGKSGAATGVHLHFEVRINDKPVNPIGYLRR